MKQSVKRELMKYFCILLIFAVGVIAPNPNDPQNAGNPTNQGTSQTSDKNIKLKERTEEEKKDIESKKMDDLDFICKKKGVDVVEKLGISPEETERFAKGEKVKDKNSRIGKSFKLDNGEEVICTKFESGTSKNFKLRIVSQFKNKKTKKEVGTILDLNLVPGQEFIKVKEHSVFPNATDDGKFASNVRILQYRPRVDVGQNIHQVVCRIRDSKIKQAAWIKFREIYQNMSECPVNNPSSKQSSEGLSNASQQVHLNKDISKA